ncbi:uncharacterized protein LOC124899500 [Capsicum annuum]|uniref:uncharacterized protein LOC124899500 n=1 Tax=Capsicum annuum TaxID=4072 RepID=UPI001FB072CC|nr:uncharacterized protein LOC124899500 [Capsicum annuum]
MEMHGNTSYWICWKGSVIVKNIVCGTPKHEYSCLPAFSHIVELLNLGSSYSIMVKKMNGSFVNYFLDFGYYIWGYSHMRKDTKNHVHPIAFCVVDKENDASWTFFFEKLKSIVEDDPDLCVISDMHITIANAFFRVYNRAHHGLCMRHLAENVCVNQHCGEHLYLFYTSAKAYYFNECSEHFAKFKDKYLEIAHILENVFGFEKWSRAHFPGNRYNVMTTNIIASLNSLLTDERKYPVSYIFNSIAKKFGENFREWHAFVGSSNNKFVPCAEKILRGNKSMSDSLYVTNANGDLDQFTLFSSGVTSKVNLLDRSFFV